MPRIHDENGALEPRGIISFRLHCFEAILFGQSEDNPVTPSTGESDTLKMVKFKIVKFKIVKSRIVKSRIVTFGSLFLRSVQSKIIRYEV